MTIPITDERPQQIVRGVVLVIAAAFTISVQDVVFKFFSSELSLGQIFALRGMLTIPLVLTLAWVQGIRRDVLAAALRPWTLLRACFMTLMFLAFYSAIPFVNLSVLGAATYSAPIFVALLSAYIIGEPVRPLGWIAVLVGFVGVLVLLQPGTDAFSPWVLLPLMGAGFYAFAHIITRAKCQSVPLAAMALSLQLVMMTAGLTVSAGLLLWRPDASLVDAYPYLFGSWSAVGVSEWMVLGLLAALAVVIALLLAGAYQVAPPSTVATFEYSYLGFVAIWDFVFFAASPTGATLFGMFLIIAAGLLVMYRR